MCLGPIYSPRVEIASSGSNPGSEIHPQSRHPARATEWILLIESLYGQEIGIENHLPFQIPFVLVSTARGI